MQHHGPVLTSRQNPHVKYARSLHVRKHRHQERAFLVEGVRLFLDALESGAIPMHVFVDEKRLDKQLLVTLERLEARRSEVHAVDAAVLDFVADTQTPQGIVGVFPFPEIPVVTGVENPLLVVVDGVKDPGNLGTLMRAALGAGVHGLFLSPDSVDPYSPKVVRSAMGAHFKLPLRSFAWPGTRELLTEGAQRLVAEASARTSYDRIDWTQPSILVVGSETGGISDEARQYASNGVAIPLRGGLESLNAAVAGAVILFEAARQRRTQ